MAAPTNAFSTGLALLAHTDGEIAQVYKSLREWRCCPMCALRYLGEKNQDKYKFSQKEIHAYFSGLGTETLPPYTEEPCCTCLGVLQQITADAFLKKVMEKVKEGANVYSDFKISISLPVSYIVRETAIVVLMVDRFMTTYKKKHVEDFLAIPLAWKAHCGDRISKALGIPMDPKSPFEVTINFDHDDIKKECDFLRFMCPHIFHERKNNRFGWEMFTRMNVRRALNTVEYASFKHYSQCPPKKLTQIVKCTDIVCSHQPIFIAGRYNKYSRHLSQTPWIIDGHRKTESSVQERICELLEKSINPEDVRFSSAGREDVDVRTMGRGRPFMIEFVKPKVATLTQDQLNKLQKMINDSTEEVKVRDLQMCQKDDQPSFIKTGEIETCKSYVAYCWSKEPVTKAKIDLIKDTKELKIEQKTPIRVLHRRTLATRERFVHSMRAERVDDHHFKMLLRTDAGTYIKEFVHGDFGRTKPNLSKLLGSECDILELDVAEVELDWPPQIAVQ